MDSVKPEPVDTGPSTSGIPTFYGSSDAIIEEDVTTGNPTGKAEPDSEQGSGLASIRDSLGHGEDGVKNEELESKHNYLQQLVSSAPSPEILEDGVKIGISLLGEVEQSLKTDNPQLKTQADQWLTSLRELKSQAKPTRTIVGVVGNTGAGKSSVISAILDEARLLPTNCMRACTASPTELSYNESDDPSELYCAEVEFITSEDWIKELKALYDDFMDPNGEISRETANQETDAGIAYAKIKAVYPTMTKDVVKRDTPEHLASQLAVRAVLGTVKSLKATSASDLYKSLQHYVDSKEKNKDKTLEYWPLIKVVRIFTKASALATGAVLVDLPGVQDSNAARAAVAERYMKACTGLFILAPITRAVDDKTAKNLLGDSFRRQLKFDGQYSAVTFICSKTDDISVTEAVDSLNLEDHVSELWSQIHEKEARVKKLRQEMDEVKTQTSDYEDLLEDVDNQRDIWDDLLTKLTAGETVYDPSPSSDQGSRKRKRGSHPAGSRKNRSSVDSDDNDASEAELSDASDKENSQPGAANGGDREPLTEEQIETKLADLKSERKALRDKKKELDVQVASIKTITAEKDTITSEITRVCIKGRNDYSRNAIKDDFAMGIKELDEQNASEVDAEAFNPDVEMRDYDAVARSLPVFCVSSRAFQKLCGRFNDKNFNGIGFLTKEDTEIPQLQAHVRKLTENGRVASSRRFLNHLVQFLNSITIWAVSDGSNLPGEEGRRVALEARLLRELSRMEKGFDAAVTECDSAIRNALEENIFEVFDKIVPEAAEAALTTSQGWGAHRSAGGFHWSTYKALCRRQGVHSGSTGSHDLNAQLFEPISVKLVNGWEKAFQHRLPHILGQFGRTLKDLIKTFHRIVVEEARKANVNRLYILDQQLQAHVQRLADLPNVVAGTAQSTQREINRGFTPVVQEQMATAYYDGANECGTGSHVRRKNLVEDHVAQNRTSMFEAVTIVGRKDLDNLCKSLKGVSEQAAGELFAKLEQDYRTVVVGSSNAGAYSVPAAERALRDEVARVVENWDGRFEAIVTQMPASVPEGSAM